MHSLAASASRWKIERTPRPAPASLPGSQDLPCGILTRSPGQPVARMRAGSAEVKISKRRCVLRPSECGPHGEQLIQGKLAVETMSAGQSVYRLQIAGRDDLLVLHEPGHAWCVFLQRAEDGAGDIAAMVVPRPAAAQLERDVLHVHRHDVASRRRERRIRD